MKVKIFFCDLSWHFSHNSTPPLPFLHTCPPPPPPPPPTLSHFLCRRVRGSAVAPQVVQRGPPSSLSQTPIYRICPPRKGRWVLFGMFVCVPCVCVCPLSVYTCVCVCVHLCIKICVLIAVFYVHTLCSLPSSPLPPSPSLSPFLPSTQLDTSELQTVESPVLLDQLIKKAFDVTGAKPTEDSDKTLEGM